MTNDPKPTKVFHGETSAELPKLYALPLTSNQLYLVHHCIAYGQAVLNGDLAEQVVALIYMRGAEKSCPQDELNELVDKINNLSITAFPDAKRV